MNQKFPKDIIEAADKAFGKYQSSESGRQSKQSYIDGRVEERVLSANDAIDFSEWKDFNCWPSHLGVGKWVIRNRNEIAVFSTREVYEIWYREVKISGRLNANPNCTNKKCVGGIITRNGQVGIPCKKCNPSPVKNKQNYGLRI